MAHDRPYGPNPGSSEYDDWNKDQSWSLDPSEQFDTLPQQTAYERLTLHSLRRHLETGLPELSDADVLFAHRSGLLGRVVSLDNFIIDDYIAGRFGAIAKRARRMSPKAEPGFTRFAADATDSNNRSRRA